MGRFKSVYVFNDVEIGKSEEFLTTTSDFGNALATKNINKVYGGGI